MNGYEDDLEVEIETTADDAKLKAAADGIVITMPPYAAETLIEAAARRMTEHMTKQLDKMLDARVKEVCNDAWVAAITDRARAAADEYIMRPRVPTNTWGEPDTSKKPMAFADQIPGIVEKWLEATVQADGTQSRDSYGQSRGTIKRLDWMVRQLVTEPLKKETEKAAKTVEEQARKVVAAHVGKFVAEQMIPAIDAKQIS